MIKKLIVPLIVPVLLIASCGTKQLPSAEVPTVTGNFEVSVLKTGKSDAIILRSEGKTAVIDCGEKNDGDKVVDALTAFGCDTIDYLFITHFDKDHVGGAAEVVSEMNIGQTITPAYVRDSDEYDAFMTAEEERGYSVTQLTEAYNFVMGDVLFEIFPPHEGEYEDNDNDFSIVIKATHGEDTMLFAGDSEDERVGEILAYDIKCDFLKVPHHGRYEDKTPAFIKKVSPEYAVITCSKKEPADDEVLDLLDNIGCETFLTTNGTVNVTSTGNGIEVTQESQ